MRLTVIGCSPAWPDPGGAHSGYLIESAGRSLLLDCGPGVLARLRAGGLFPVDAVAVTHLHLDHWGDLVPWAWLAAHGPARPARAELWLPPAGRGALDAFAARFGSPGMFEPAFALREYDSAPFQAAGMTVQPLRVEHYALPAYGFRITAGGRVLAYSGDSGPCEALRELAAGADLFLCEATLRDGGDDAPTRGHISVEEALQHAAGRVLVTHRPVELPVSDGIERAREGLRVEV
ncbi:MAG: MBL fold metallo-hydrolase [Thermoleophilia bacterium]|nr:MBL fold metallo-hydrolase [Thermoleophilia bacterium]